MTFGLVVARWAHVAPPRGLFHVVGAIVALALTLLSARRAHADELHARVDTNVVDVFVGYLRRKLDALGAPRLIDTVRGVGFVLRGS